MKVLLSVTFIYLLQTSLLEGFTVRSRNNQILENASYLENPKQPSSFCSENCTFVINSDSLITAQKTFQKFMEFKKSVLLYLNIKTLNFTLKPGDQKKLNQFQEWHWTLTENVWYLGLPIDLDYASFHITYIGESRIRLNIDSLNSDCCLINDAAIDQIRNRLWSDVFSNESKALLCNRYFEHQDWKITFFVITTVWLGYDLFCKGPDVDKAHSEQTNASASLLIPILCFFISMYYPLVNKLIESNPVGRQLQQIEQNLSDGMQLHLTDYLEGDSPFGYRRRVLKYFFVSKLFKDNDEISKFLPMHRLNCIYCFLFFIYSLLPMVLEVTYDVEELKDFDSIYKLGMPIFNFTEQIKHFVKIDYRLQIAVSVIIIPFISIANFFSYKRLSESQDFLIYLKWNSWCFKTKEKIVCISCIITEDVDDVINTIKIRCIGETDQVPETTNTENQEKITTHATRIMKFINEFKKLQYYSKFIKRISLILSKNFWIHIWIQSTTTKSCCYFSKQCNCQENSTRNPVLIVLKYAIGVFIFFPFNCIFIILTCAFPTLWLMVFILTFRLREIFSSKYHEIEPSECCDCCVSSSTPRANLQDETNESTHLIQTVQHVPKKTKNCNWRLVEIIRLIFIDVPVILLLYLQLSIIVLIVRSTMYIVFVAIANYDNLTSFVVVGITCASYLGSFLTKFMDKYTTILRIIFDEVRVRNQPDIENNAESENPTKSTSTDKKYFVTEDCFDYVIDHSFSVREEYFFVLFKSVITILFFIVSIGILLGSNVLDTASKLNNIIELIMVIVAPHLILKFVETDSNASIQDHKKDIKFHTNQFMNSKETNKNNTSDKSNESIASGKNKENNSIWFILLTILCCCDPRCDKGDEDGKNVETKKKRKENTNKNVSVEVVEVPTHETSRDINNETENLHVNITENIEMETIVI